MPNASAERASSVPYPSTEALRLASPSPPVSRTVKEAAAPVRFTFTVKDGSLRDTTDVALFDRVLGGDLPFAWGHHGSTPDDRPLPTPEELADYLPVDGHLTRSYEVIQGSEVIGEGPGYIAQIALYPGWMLIRVAADSPKLARSIGDTVLERMAEPPSDEDADPAEIRFRVWSNGRPEPRTTWAASRALSWNETAHNYPSRTAVALDALVEARPGESGRLDGSLLLFHGPPGVGKTSATRVLVREWSDWCDFETVTDPEKLFADPNYLLSVVEGKKPSDVTECDAPRLRCLVLEDADNYLHAEIGAREAAISRLLNTADGLLGNAGLLILLTMNTPARRLNPALLRPGRMFASVGFELFEQAEARTWLGRQENVPVGGISLAEMLHLRGDLGQITTSRETSASGYL